MAAPSAYSAEQVDAYLDHIQLPARYRPNAYPPRNYALLHALHVHQLAAIPYENLLLHYSSHRTVSIDPMQLYEKMVVNGRGRGGYCMENCIFFNHILRAFGFDAYTTGARIRLRQGGVPWGDFVGWRHIVNIVTLEDGGRYMVDVSFGGDGPTRPLPLIEQLTHTNLGAQEVRLIWDRLPEQVSSRSASWIYQYRNGVEKPWNSYYSFNEVEWLPADFIGPNYYVSTHPDSFQRHTPVVVRFVRDQQTIVGKRMLSGEVVKENRGAKTVVLRVCRSEADRIDALRELFDLELTPDERDAIEGYTTQIHAYICLAAGYDDTPPFAG